MATTINTEKIVTSADIDNDAVKKYNWQYIFNVAKRHKRQLVMANIIAIIATLASVPVPLLMPLLVDEVLLDKPGIVVSLINSMTPTAWQGRCSISSLFYS